MAKTKSNNSVEKEQVSEQKKFPLPALRSACLDLFGCSSAVFDGATYGLTGKYSVDEIKDRIEKFKKTKIGGK